MLSAFCAGRPTSLVIDFGARETRIIPVVDGFVLRNAVVKTARGGNWLDQLLMDEIGSNGISLKPWFENQQIDGITSTFRSIHISDIVSNILDIYINPYVVCILLNPKTFLYIEKVKDIKQWMCFVPRQPLTENLLTGMRMPSYELPDGTEVFPTINICSAPEKYFMSLRGEPKALPAFNAAVPAHMQVCDISCDEDTLPELVQVCLPSIHTSKLITQCKKRLIVQFTAGRTE